MYLAKRQQLGAFPIAAVLGLVAASLPFVIGLFKKGKPTLTAAQLEILSHLPEPYLSRAVAELEASANMSQAFPAVFEKYSILWQKDKQAKQKTIITLAIVGVFAVVAGVVGYVLLKRS